MADIIAIANPKGGSAKTSTAVNLCCALAAAKRRVLLVDLDPQCNATVALGLQPDAASGHSLAESLMHGTPVAPCIVPYERGHFDIIPAADDLTTFAVGIYNEPHADLRLRACLADVSADYHFIFLDCPPATNALTVNALCASRYLLIPMPCEYFAVDALRSLVGLYARLNATGAAAVKLLGVVRTLYDEGRDLSVQISRELIGQFGDLLFNCIIGYNPRISEATTAGRPVLLYDKSSQGARSYLVLAGEFLQRLKKADH